MQRFGVRLRRGMTLIELLVVIGIIATLAAVTIPIMVPAVESRRMREAARGVSTFISAARARAVELNRPVGIHFQPLENEAGASMTMFYVEQPAPFAGLEANETVTLSRDTTTGYLVATFNAGIATTDLVRVGDLMKLNFQGHLYRIDQVNTTGGIVSSVWLRKENHERTPWKADGTEQVPYQIFRQPVPSAGQPYQLPDGIVVDLHWSGTDSGQTYPREIIFAPSGHVTQVRWAASGSFEKPTGAIYLLVGRRENVDTATSTFTNLGDANCLWITINHQTGQSKAVENSTMLDNGTVVTGVFDARRFARDQMALGGR